MGSKKSIAILVSAAVLSYTSPINAAPVNNQPSPAQQVQEVVSHLDGAMDTSAQASANPKAPDVRITTCQVTVKNAGAIARPHAVFMYQEQALSQRLSQPYRQRFLRIAPSIDNNSIESAVFRPPTPQAWIGLCNKPEVQRIVDANDIGTSNCSVFLRRQQQNYIGETSASGCPSNYKGAVRITNRITLHQAGMDTWDRGFDATGNQVWGAEGEAYQFRWVEGGRGAEEQRKQGCL